MDKYTPLDLKAFHNAWLPLLGEQDHEAYLERPFLEARVAIHHRMHELGLTH